MKYWTENIDNHIRLVETDVYQSYPALNGNVNLSGYIDGNLGKTDVLYMGTCDIMSGMPNGNARWSKLLHDTLYPNTPFMTIGSPAAGLPSMLRRLNSFIYQHGAPSILYFSVARFEGYEYVNDSGKCYNVNSRAGTPRFLKKRNLLTDHEYEVWNAQIAAYKNLYNVHNNRYILEERFTLLELLCKAHNIKFKWCFNLSDASIVSLYRNISIFKDLNNFMQESFIGLTEIKDMLPDRSMGEKSHYEIYKKYLSTTSWDYDLLCESASINYTWLTNTFGNDLIKNEA